MTESFEVVGEAEWAQLESPDPTCLVSVSTAKTSRDGLGIYLEGR